MKWLRDNPLGWGIFFIVCGSVTIGLLLPGSQVPSFVGPNDKLIHFLSYFVFAFSLGFAIYGSWPAFPRWVYFAIPFGVAIIHGASTEIVQFWIPSRSSDFYDFLADIKGGGWGASAYTILISFIWARLARKTARLPFPVT